jgi:hypothetical protein
MTYQIDTASETITVEFEGQTITLPLDRATDFVMNVIGARKAGYAAKKEMRATEIAARKEAAALKAKAKAEASEKRNADRIAKLKKQLADLEAAA